MSFHIFTINYVYQAEYTWWELMKLIREVGNIVQDNWDKGVDTKTLCMEN